LSYRLLESPFLKRKEPDRDRVLSPAGQG